MNLDLLKGLRLTSLSPALLIGQWQSGVFLIGT